MKYPPLILVFLCAFAAMGDERIRWLVPVGDNMVLRRESTEGEPATPLLRFQVSAPRIRKVSLTLGGTDVPLKPGKIPGTYEVPRWGKLVPADPGDLRLKVDLRDGTAIEERFTNVVASKVFLFGDRAGLGALTSVPATNRASADLRLLVPGVSGWFEASPDWIDPNRNPLAISPDAKTIISRLLAVDGSMGLVVVELTGSALSATNGLRRATTTKVTGAVWFHEARARSISSFHSAKGAWLDEVARAQRQGRVPPEREWLPPEPLQVVVEGNLPPHRIDAAFW